MAGQGRAGPGRAGQGGLGRDTRPELECVEAVAEQSG